MGSHVASFLNLGINPALPPPLIKRIPITNATSLFGTLVMIVTIPIDRVQAPAWMVVLDVMALLIFASLALLNWRGQPTASRLACIIVSNALVFSNAIGLGPDCG